MSKLLRFQAFPSAVIKAFAVACALACVHHVARGDGPGKPITLEFWDFPHLPETNEYLARAMQEFEKQNPGVRIRYTRLPWLDGQQKVTLAVLSGQPPDVCGQVSAALPGFAMQNVLEPLNPYFGDTLSDYHASYLESVSHNGQIYAVPWYKACYVMLLNLDLFEEFGVEPPRNGRWTWDEFLAKMKALTRQPKSGYLGASGRSAYYGIVTNTGPMEYEAYSIIFNFGGRVLKKNAKGNFVPAVKEPDFVQGLKQLQSLEFEHKVALPGIGAATQDQSWSTWRDGRFCAVTIQGAWCITAARRANEAIEASNAKKKAEGRIGELEKPMKWMIAAAPSPDVKTTPTLTSTGLGTYVVFKQNDPKRREMAAKFAMFLVSGEGQKVLKYENVYPSRKSAGNPFAGDAALEPIFELFPDAVLPPLIPGGERIDRVLQQEVQKALLRNPSTGEPQMSAESAVESADMKIRAVLERAQRRIAAER